MAGNEGTISGTSFDDAGIGNTGIMTLTNSIIAYTAGADGCASNTTTVTILNTLIEDGTCGITNNVDGNKTGDPQLFPLVFNADRGTFELDENGALTKSHEPQASSVVIGGGNPTYCTATDQINYARGAGNCDMGSIETDGVPTAVRLGDVSAEIILPSLGLFIILSAILLLIFGTIATLKRG